MNSVVSIAAATKGGSGAARAGEATKNSGVFGIFWISFFQLFGIQETKPGAIGRP